MIALDVNILTSAFHAGAADHDAMRTWLEATVNGPETVGVSPAVLTGTLRILTHPKVFSPPATPQQATAVLSALVSHPNVAILRTGAHYWERLVGLTLAAQAKGNLVADAGHAATALEHNARFVSKDRDFARFEGLNWQLPK